MPRPARRWFASSRAGSAVPVLELRAGTSGRRLFSRPPLNRVRNSAPDRSHAGCGGCQHDPADTGDPARHRGGRRRGRIGGAVRTATQLYARVPPRFGSRGTLGWACTWSDELFLLRGDTLLELASDATAVVGCIKTSAGKKRYLSLCYGKADIGVIAQLGEAADERVRATVRWWAGWSPMIQIGPEPPHPVSIPQDNSPAARARRARRKLRRLFEKARGAAQGQGRLGRDQEYELLRCAYGAVRRWKREGVGQEIEHELRVEAPVPISRKSSLFLMLLRSALPRLDGNVLRRWPLHLRPLMIRPFRPSGWRRFCGTMAGSRVQPASAPRPSGELHRSVGSSPSEAALPPQ